MQGFQFFFTGRRHTHVIFGKYPPPGRAGRQAHGPHDERRPPRAGALGLRFLLLSADAKVLDCGCGGGANIRTLLKKCPQGIVKGVDISDVSVTTARRVNRSAIADGRCAVWQGSVDELIFAADWFDAVTAFETVYFWPDLPKSFREIRRVLRPGGTLLICNECSGDAPGDEAWTKKIAGMRIYPAAELQRLLEQAGFRRIQIHKTSRWLCLTAQKPD